MSIMTVYRTLNIPEGLFEDLQKIAQENEIPMTWSRLAKNALSAWVAMYKARGNVR